MTLNPASFLAQMNMLRKCWWGQGGVWHREGGRISANEVLKMILFIKPATELLCCVQLRAPCYQAYCTAKAGPTAQGLSSVFPRPQAPPPPQQDASLTGHGEPRSSRKELRPCISRSHPPTWHGGHRPWKELVISLWA